MGACSAVFVSAAVLAGDVDGSSRAFALLDAALVKAWAEPDPRVHVYQIFHAAVVTDPTRAVDRIRRASAELERYDLPPSSHTVQGTLARWVAAHDRPSGEMGGGPRPAIA